MASEPPRKRIRVSHGGQTKEVEILKGISEVEHRNYIASEFGLPPTGFKVQPDAPPDPTNTNTAGVMLPFECVQHDASYTASLTEVGSSAFHFLKRMTRAKGFFL